MSDSTDRPDWLLMQPTDFTADPKASQDTLFLVDQPDACGTEAMEGFGFGASLWDSEPISPPTSTDPHA